MIGRTTQGGYISIMQHNIRKLSAQLQTLSVQAGSGLSITRPSDAPADMAALMKLREALSDQDVWGANANLGMTLMNVADSALDAANNTLDSTLETAVAMASETYNADDRAEAADEIRALKERWSPSPTPSTAAATSSRGRTTAAPPTTRPATTWDRAQSPPS